MLRIFTDQKNHLDPWHPCQSVSLAVARDSTPRSRPRSGSYQLLKEQIVSKTDGEYRIADAFSRERLDIRSI